MTKFVYQLCLGLFVLLAFQVQAQYKFETVVDCQCSNIKNQQNTGTCWSFATVSFLESELMRLGKGDVDISEMQIVRTIYKDKARNYVLRQGKANFSQGSLAHDVIRAFQMGGVVPESVYSGIPDWKNGHDHSEMEAVMKGMLDGVIAQKKPSVRWMQAVEAVMDEYMGKLPATFDVSGKKMDATSYAASTKLNPNDYISLTSFTHHPYNSHFILEIPDNYSNGSFYNVPMEDLEAVVENAVKKGYSVAWDGDVSEKGFSASNGIAVMSEDEKREDLFKAPANEVAFTAEKRQIGFESFATTDDHLMHLTGIAKDQNGTRYYVIKNSWGPIGTFNGYVYMSQPYFQMKTVSILVHKDAIPAELRKAWNL